jgi:hypothetical protein
MYTRRTLDQLRAAATHLADAVREYTTVADADSADAEHDAAARVADDAATLLATFDALDGALCAGAHLPDQWSQCRPDRRCNHDAPALREVEALACECGALITPDGPAEADQPAAASPRLDYRHARRYFYAATGIPHRDLETQQDALHFAMNGTDGNGYVLYDPTRLAAWCDAWRAIHDR